MPAADPIKLCLFLPSSRIAQACPLWSLAEQGDNVMIIIFGEKVGSFSRKQKLFLPKWQ
jgi:hypothetical protein